mmetsp:Transcript_25766/g.43185  ORF Transcript_25766/g.43185 Transcript_25766/m.43185 type:complete len:219 (-) Transcript_25766:177-833(-)
MKISTSERIVGVVSSSSSSSLLSSRRRRRVVKEYRTLQLVTESALNCRVRVHSGYQHAPAPPMCLVVDLAGRGVVDPRPPKVTNGMLPRLAHRQCSVAPFLPHHLVDLPVALPLAQHILVMVHRLRREWYARLPDVPTSPRHLYPSAYVPPSELLRAAHDPDALPRLRAVVDRQSDVRRINISIRLAGWQTSLLLRGHLLHFGLVEGTEHVAQLLQLR